MWWDAKLQDTLTQQEVVDLLKAEQGAATTTAYARTLSCSVQYLSDVYSGRRNPGKKLLNAIKISKVSLPQIYRKWR